MDYNRENRGFVCFMQRNFQKRTVYIAFTFFISILAFILNMKFHSEATEFDFVMIAFAVLAISPLIIAINPKIFILKLAGFLASLGSVLVLLHNLNKLEELTQNEIFSIYFVLVGICGFAILVSLLSWFVYNARSSEVNEI